jgi:hypothetical protein
VQHVSVKSEMCSPRTLCSENLKDRSHFVEIDASGKATLNCNVAKKKCRLNSSGSAYNPTLRICAHRNEFRGNREFLYNGLLNFR